MTVNSRIEDKIEEFKARGHENRRRVAQGEFEEYMRRIAVPARQVLEENDGDPDGSRLQQIIEGNLPKDVVTANTATKSLVGQVLERFHKSVAAGNYTPIVPIKPSVVDGNEDANNEN